MRGVVQPRAADSEGGRDTPGLLPGVMIQPLSQAVRYDETTGLKDGRKNDLRLAFFSFYV